MVSAFFGMIIRIYHADHNPPHFHVEYGEMEAVIEIKTGSVEQGKLPPRLLRMIQEWRKLHRFELEREWRVAQERRPLKKIKALE